MRVKATVVHTEGKIAIVESERLSACEGCHKHADGCSVCSLMGSNKKISARAKNNLGAREGDIVEIETETKTVLFYAMIVFIIPVVLMLLLYAASGFYGIPERWRYIMAMTGFVMAFFGVWMYSKFSVSKRCDAEIVKIITEKKED